MDVAGTIAAIYQTFQAIREVVETVQSFPDESRELQQRATCLLHSLQVIEKDPSLHVSTILQHVMAFDGVVRDVFVFLQELNQKSRLRRALGHKEIRQAFQDLHGRLDRCRSDITLGIVIAPRAARATNVPSPGRCGGGSRDPPGSTSARGDSSGSVQNCRGRTQPTSHRSTPPTKVYTATTPDDKTPPPPPPPPPPDSRCRAQDVVIGIDLGTSYSCVAVWRDGIPRVIPNEYGNHHTPSCVAFRGKRDQVLVGEAALYEPSSNSANTIYDVKRLIGRRWDDPVVQSDRERWAFDVVDDGKDGFASVQVEVHGERRQLTPEEISAYIIGKLKENAEDFLKKRVTHAVITVPAHFDMHQRRSTRQAGKAAGLKVLRVIAEPTAAAIAYGLDNKDEFPEVVGSSDNSPRLFVFDLGGGTFDVALLAVEDGIFDVLATAGDAAFGGTDFDNCLFDHIIKNLRQRYGDSFELNKSGFRRLRTACEHAKCTLTHASTAHIEVHSLCPGVDYYEEVTRDLFNSLCMDYFSRCISLCAEVLESAKERKENIHHIVLIGGSSRIPKLQSMISEFFDGKEVCTSTNPDEAVALGAAMQAAMSTEKGVDDMLLLDATPFPLGVEVYGGRMHTLIEKRATVPTKKAGTFTTLKDNQPSVMIAAFEGEERMAKDNVYLGCVTLNGIPPMPKGQPQIEVIFDVDECQVLQVTAVEKSTGRSGSMVCNRRPGRRMYDEATLLTKHVIKDRCSSSKPKKKKTKPDKEKAEGDIHFRYGDYNSAMECYSHCVALLKEQGDGKSELAVKAYSNRAACRAKLGDHDGTISDCSTVLQVQPDNVKALIRRAMAYEACGEYEYALEDVDAVLSMPLDAVDVDNRNLCLQVKQRLFNEC